MTPCEAHSFFVLPKRQQAEQTGEMQKALKLGKKLREKKSFSKAG